MDDRRPMVVAFFIAIIVLIAGGGYYVFRDRTTGGSEYASRPLEDATRDRVSSPSGDLADDLTDRLEQPSFDIVRVDPAGTAVIAGAGAPGSTAVILANGAPLAEAVADAAGDWIIYLDEPLPTGAVELGLAMRLDDGREVRSDQVVVIAIPETRDGEPLVILGSPGGASRVLQSPLEDLGLDLALIAVDYDDAGGVIFSGRGEPGTRVRVLADGNLIGETRVTANGAWRLTAGAILPPGRYELQIDQLDAQGRVTAVIAAPFERATPEELAEIGPRTVIVQPGNSLWRIARRLYGSGWQYTVIYAANDTQIRDPDLIYPGQVFDIPESDGSEGPLHGDGSG